MVEILLKHYFRARDPHFPGHSHGRRSQAQADPSANSAAATDTSGDSTQQERRSFDDNKFVYVSFHCATSSGRNSYRIFFRPREYYVLLD